MANVRKEDRVQDADIKRLNHVGLGLKAIAEILGCHPATITLRLAAMGISPTDTRRSFMEQVWNSLDSEQQDWLSHNLYNTGVGIKEFVTALIRREYVENPGTVEATPAPMPELEGGTPKADLDEQTAGGLAYGPNDKLDPDQQMEPEHLEEVPETLPPPPPESKKKLHFA